MRTPHIKQPTSFDNADLLARGRNVAKQGGGPDQHDQLVKQSEKWVAQTFYGTLLKQMRESPFHSDLFEGGNGGKSFETLFDQRLADHMSRHAGGKLVGSIVRKIEAGQAAKKHAANKYASASRKHLTAGTHHHSSSLEHKASHPLRRLHDHLTREHA